MIVRVKYEKTAQGRFMSHLDLVRTMHRAFLRAGLPIAYSQGFNPHPRVSFGSALAVGLTSEGEYLDMELRKEMPLQEIREKSDASLPPGIKVLCMKEIEGTKKESLGAIINMARYRVFIPIKTSFSETELQRALDWFCSQEELMVTRKTKKGEKSLDIKEGIYWLKGYIKDDGLFLEMNLKTGNNGNVKPEEVTEFIMHFFQNQLDIKAAGLFVIHRIGLYVYDLENADFAELC